MTASRVSSVFFLCAAFLMGMPASAHAQEPQGDAPRAEEAPAEGGEAAGEIGILEELKLFSKAMGAIQEGYVEEVPARALFYGSAQGMVGVLADKYSEFIDPQRYELLQIIMRGEYAGIGAILEIVDERPTIKGIQPGAAAEKAGLQAGDQIRRVDGVDVEKKPIPELSALLRGKEGSDLLITVFRPSAAQILDVRIVREKVVLKAVEDVRMVGRALGYIRIDDWTENTAKQFDKSVQELTAKGMKALVVDLRDNDGGLLTVAVEVAERFLGEGKKIVEVKSRIPEQRKEYFSSGKSTLPPLPLVVLVNGNSASASEIFSAAMQDHKRATVVGTVTFGKASVQSVVPLDERSAMKLTTARYLSPLGRAIDGVGITPDEVVANEPSGAAGADRQTLRALELLKDYR